MPEYFVMKVPIEEFLARHPEFSYEVLYDPPEIRGMIDRWTHVIWTAVTITYPKEWTDETCIREFIQNALDASEEETGEAVCRVYHDRTIEPAATVIEDEGRGIEENAVLMGGTDKPCWARGFFGEGLKMSVAYILTKYGTPTYLFNRRGEVFKTVSLRGVLTFVYGRHRLEPRWGTKVVIPGVLLPIEGILLEDWQKERVIFETMLIGIRGGEEFCLYERPCRIMDDGLGNLYVAEIFVNSLERISGDKGRYSWDLWWVPLHRGRTAPVNLEALLEQCTLVLGNMQLVDDAVRYFSGLLAFDGVAVVPSGSWFEYAIDIPYELVSGCNRILAKIFGVSEDKVVRADSEVAANEASYRGYLPVASYLFVYPFRRFFRALPTYEVKEIERTRKTLEEIEFLSECDLVGEHRTNFFILRGMNLYLGDLFGSTPRLRVAGNLYELRDALGLHCEGEIWIDKEQLTFLSSATNTLVHEWAHFIVHVNFPGRDIEHSGDYYWRGLEWVAATLAHKAPDFGRIVTYGEAGVPFLSLKGVKYMLGLEYRIHSRIHEETDTWISLEYIRERDLYRHVNHIMFLPEPSLTFYFRPITYSFSSMYSFTVGDCLHLDPERFNDRAIEEILSWIRRPRFSDTVSRIRDRYKTVVLLKYDVGIEEYVVRKLDMDSLIRGELVYA